MSWQQCNSHCYGKNVWIWKKQEKLFPIIFIIKGPLRYYADLRENSENFLLGSRKRPVTIFLDNFTSLLRFSDKKPVFHDLFVAFENGVFIIADRTTTSESLIILEMFHFCCLFKDPSHTDYISYDSLGFQLFCILISVTEDTQAFIIYHVCNDPSQEMLVLWKWKQGPRRGRGWGPGPSHFGKKIKLRNTHFQIKGIFDGIRIFDWRTSPKHPNLWLVRFVGKPQNDYLYKTTLGRRLLRFHQPGDVLHTPTNSGTAKGVVFRCWR